MKQRGIFERERGSGIWWVRHVDAQGRLRREKAGTKSAAIALYRKRKTEALEGRKLPEKFRRPPFLSWTSPVMHLRSRRRTSARTRTTFES
jgi:hypothetical protein